MTEVLKPQPSQEPTNPEKVNTKASTEPEGPKINSMEQAIALILSREAAGQLPLVKKTDD